MKRIIAAACLLVLAGCYNDKQDKLYPTGTTVCDTTNITFGKDVLPILTKNCITSGCHDVTASSGYDLRSFEGAYAAVANEQLIKSITHDPGLTPMPQNMPKLSDCDINKIIRWVNLGAQNN